MHNLVNSEEMAILFENLSDQREDNLMLKMNNTLEEIILTTETLMSAVQDITEIVNEEVKSVSS